ncbi:GntR family transcriptional regulator [Achromobacter sp. GG226]|uniref:GntR family transcriptional regulator n=1 Tax=Verticiella alkaliphila TaxID=2779529 RepID=UPI001C0C2F05|nr:GntR family transcriptional regulator [Verticiella sp. GG226]MBU4612629.1 GntR family transcriptional regulator [Verticiella sp. GG226]
MRESAATPETNASSQMSQTLRAQLGLRELILDGELASGARISELWVVERLGVSRTPVRAALLRLQEEGFLEPIPSGGFAVRSFTEEDVWDAIEVRGTLEGLAARLAAERGVPARTLRELQQCVAEIDAILQGGMTADKFTQYIEVNERFHRLLAKACGSAVLERQLEKATSSPFASPSGFVMVQSMAADAHEVLVLAQAQHRGVIEAIEHREGARAEALMREHARIAHRNLKSAFDSQKAMTQLQGGNLIRRAHR